MKRVMTYTGVIVIALASSSAMARGGSGGGGNGAGFGASDGFSGFQSNSANAIYGESKKFKYQHQNQHSYQYAAPKEAAEDRSAQNSHAFGQIEQ